MERKNESLQNQKNPTMTAIHPETILRDWTTSSPRIQADSNAKHTKPPLPVATFISNLFMNHASELGSRFQSKGYPKRHHQQDDDDEEELYHSSNVMDGGEFHVINGQLLQVVTAQTLEEEYPEVTSTSPSHRRDRSRHWSPSIPSSSSASCVKDPLFANPSVRKWMRKKHKGGKGGGGHKGKNQNQKALYGTRLNKNKSSRQSKKQQGLAGDFSMKPGKGTRVKSGSKKQRNRTHVVPDPHMGGMHTYRPHSDSMEDFDVSPEEYYYITNDESVVAPTHQHMTRTATAYPVYENPVEVTTTTMMRSSRRRPGSPPPPSVFATTANTILQDSLEKIQQIPCLSKDWMEKESREESTVDLVPEGEEIEDKLQVLEEEIQAIDKELALQELEEVEDIEDPTTEEEEEDMTFDHFMQDQKSILEESQEDWEPASFINEAREETNVKEEEEEETFSSESFEVALTSISVPSVEATVNVKSMIETFEAGAHGPTSEGDTPSLQVLSRQEEESAVSMVQTTQEEPTMVLPSSSTAITTKSKDPFRVPQDGYMNEKKILVVGSRQSGKTRLIKSLIGSSEDDTKQRRFQMNANGEERLNCGVDVKSWTPASTMGSGEKIRYSLWDLPGSSFEDGLHPSTQSVYFSPNSLYIVVWDISAIDGLHEDYEYYDDLMEQHENRIDHDINEKVLFWIKIIAARVKGCAILPVVTHRDKLGRSEVEHRISRLMDFLRQYATSANIVFNSDGEIPLVSSIKDQGLIELESTIVSVTSTLPLLREHVGTTRNLEIVAAVQRVIQCLKAKGLMIEHILAIQREVYAELGIEAPQQSNETLGLPTIIGALKFLSSTGSVIYFGLDSEDDILSQAVILDPRWIASALSCILRYDLIGKLRHLKKKKSTSALKNDEIVEYHEAFHSKSSDVAVVSRADTSLLWDSRYQMKKVKEKFDSDHNFALYQYLRTLCERHGVFVPFTTSPKENSPTFYLLPSLFKKVPEDNWSYNPSLHHKTTLCQSWVFNDGLPKNLVDVVIVSVLKGLFHMHDSRRDEYSYHAKVDEIKCWKNAFSARIVEFFCGQNDRKNTNIIKIQVNVVDKNSAHCVNSNQMVIGEKKLIVSATGNIGNNGGTIWNLGYGEAINRVEKVIEDLDDGNIEREVICPECLRSGQPNVACSFCHDKLTLDQYESECPRGHRVNPSLLLGQNNDRLEADCVSVSTSGLTSIDSMVSIFDSPGVENIEELLESVVLVGLWDKDTQEIRSVGSGFIGDAKRGFVVTASHIFYENPVGKEVGPVYHGLKNGKAVIGIIPKTSAGHENDGARFTYCADIIADDVRNTDACILRITSKFSSPIKVDGVKLEIQPERILNKRDVVRERLQRLKCKSHCKIADNVRVLGFNQEGEGLLEKGTHVDRMPCITKGYVSKKMSSESQQNLTEFDESQQDTAVFVPNSEIVVICNTKFGHSGGPCINLQGEVIGIVSRADPVEKDRSYLVPARQLNILLNKAKTRFETGKNHEFMNRFYNF